MGSIFDPDVPRDIYLDHMRNVMSWIEDKIRDDRVDPPHKGYHVEISVEARWLQQLIAECVAKHQMLLDCQKRLGAMVEFVGQPRFRVPDRTARKDGSDEQ